MRFLVVWPGQLTPALILRQRSATFPHTYTRARSLALSLRESTVGVAAHLAREKGAFGRQRWGRERQ